MVYCVLLWRCGAFVCVPGFQNRPTTPQSNAFLHIEQYCLLLHRNSFLPLARGLQISHGHLDL